MTVSRILSFLAITLLTSCSCLAKISPDEITRAPYVQLSTHSSIHIVWRTQKPIQPVIHFGKSIDNLDLRSTPEQAVTRRTKLDSPDSTTAPLYKAPDGTYQYEVKISDLAPDSTYYYAVYDDKSRLTPESETYYFKTHPKAGTAKELNIWALGDSGTGGSDQKRVHAEMREYIKEHSIDLDMFIHVGDMAYQHGKDTEFQNNFFDIYDTTLRNTVCWPAMGNHEGHTSSGESGVGPYYDAYITPTKGEAGGLPSGNESYYSYDYGRAHFIVLNSYDLDRKPSATMAQWLREDLAKTSPKKTDWIIAFWHHPPYTKGSHDSDKEVELIEMREYILPILESSGVDLVLTGHSHIYERSMLMDGAYETPTIAENKIFDDGDGDIKGDGSYQKSPGLVPNQGTVQAVIGHGGKLSRRSGSPPVMKKSILEYGSLLINIKGDILSANMLNDKGLITDSFQISKEKTVTPQRIANPFKLDAPPVGRQPDPNKKQQKGKKK